MFPSVYNGSCSIAFELWSCWTWWCLTEQCFCLGVELRWREATKCSNTFGVQTVITFLNLMPTVDEWFSCMQGLCNDGNGVILRGELGNRSLVWVDGDHEGTFGTRELSSLLAGFICFLFFFFNFFNILQDVFVFSHNRSICIHFCRNTVKALDHMLIYFSFRICYRSEIYWYMPEILSVCALCLQLDLITDLLGTPSLEAMRTACEGAKAHILRGPHKQVLVAPLGLRGTAFPLCRCYCCLISVDILFYISIEF